MSACGIMLPARTLKIMGLWDYGLRGGRGFSGGVEGGEGVLDGFESGGEVGGGGLSGVEDSLVFRGDGAWVILELVDFGFEVVDIFGDAVDGLGEGIDGVGDFGELLFDGGGVI